MTEPRYRPFAADHWITLALAEGYCDGRSTGNENNPYDAMDPRRVAYGTGYEAGVAAYSSAPPAPEPKQGSEEPQLGTVEPLNAGQIVALRAENERLQGIIMGTSAEYRVTLGVNLRRYWSAENQVMLGRMLFDEDVPALRAELAAAREEISKLREMRAPTTPTVEMVRLRQSNQNLMMLYANAIGECRKINKAIHRVLRGKNNAVKQLAAEKARADRAEERVCVLEQEIVSWRNAQSVHFLGESGEREAAPRRRDAEIRLNVIADTILAARANKEGESRG